jgi:hypothetical protein
MPPVEEPVDVWARAAAGRSMAAAKVVAIRILSLLGERAGNEPSA